jgi:hypothetical protein
MIQTIRQIRLKFFALAMLLIAGLMVGGINIASAQREDNNKHRNDPVWEEVNREIELNPEKPAPPDVVAQLVSLKVTYRDFNGRTRTGIVEVNRELKDDVISFFKYAYYLHFPIKEIAVSSDPRFAWDDNKLMAANVTSCFNYRTIAGTDRPSQHGLGRACDINPRQNPYITLDEQGNPVVQPNGATWNVGTPGTLHGDHPLIQLMESRGWVWGGSWTLQDLDGAVIDYQHLQKRAQANTAAPADRAEVKAER